MIMERFITLGVEQGQVVSVFLEDQRSVAVGSICFYCSKVKLELEVIELCL